MVFQTTVYHVWREKNARRHQKGIQGTAQLIRVIDKAIRNRVLALRYKPPHKLEGPLLRWFEVFDT